MSNCASLEKRDRFLEHIAKIAPITQRTEVDCLGYAWFRSAGDNDVVPHHWLRGLEITPQANSVDHRASEEYKAFRAAVAGECLLSRPSDLRFWRPMGIGYDSREGGLDLAVRAQDRPRYAVVHELEFDADCRGVVKATLARLAGQALETPAVLSFWPLGREEEDGGSTLVFSLFYDKEAAETFESAPNSCVWQKIAGLCKSQRRTTWIECGIGFIGRK
ncbi:unnamed protein product [Clonostachys byssicola]|uniref:Uncharacterized protein n=1 Tax=Clonostachys byssicola TaxID=160290 RepID=A0A9N9XZU5_9HYPO|nr:unnamed protein product [Clonostachys byssicola]